MHRPPRFCAYAALIFVCLAALTAACESVDPTEQFFAITFSNDLGRPAVLRACSDRSCRRFSDTWKIAPGDVVTDNISDRGVLTRWLVEAASGSRKCLPVIFNAKYDTVVVRLSQAEACPGRPLSSDKVEHGKRQTGET